MAHVVVMPKLGLTMEKGTITSWFAAEGEQLRLGELIAEISTDKITYELEAEAEGTLLTILVPEDHEVEVGTPIALIGQVEEDGSGIGFGTSPGSEMMPQTAPPVEVLDDVSAGQGDVTTEPRGRLAKEIRYTGMRRTIGQRMEFSHKTAATVNYEVLADVHELRQMLGGASQNLCGLDPGVDGDLILTAAVVKAAALTLKKMPRFNASLDGDVIKIWRDVNIGVAVALPQGLIVPVVKQANEKRHSEIAREIRDLAERARNGELQPDEIEGGSFTVTTLAPYGSVDFFSPIINQPEVAILGVGRVKDSVLVFDGAPTVRATVGLSLACDHRVIDGGPAAEFLRALMDHLATPTRILA